MDANLVNYIKSVHNVNNIESYKTANNLIQYKFQNILSIIKSINDKEINNMPKDDILNLFKHNRKTCENLISNLIPRNISSLSHQPQLSHQSYQRTLQRSQNNVPVNMPSFDVIYYDYNIKLYIKRVSIKEAFKLAMYCSLGDISDPVNTQEYIKKIKNNCLLVCSIFLSIYSDNNNTFNLSKIFIENTEYRIKIIGDAFKLLSSDKSLEFIPNDIHKLFQNYRKNTLTKYSNEDVQTTLENMWNNDDNKFIEENTQNICKDKRDRECFNIYFNTHATIYGRKEDKMELNLIGDIFIRILIYIDISCTYIYSVSNKFKLPSTKIVSNSSKQSQRTGLFGQMGHMQEKQASITWFNVEIGQSGGRYNKTDILTSNGRLALIQNLQDAYSNREHIDLQLIRNKIAYLHKKIEHYKQNT